MGALERLFLRITPLIMLICFICFGITHTFNSTDGQPLTYLSHEVVNTGTQENPNNITVYNFDMNSYMSNINRNILKESVQNTIDLEGYQTNFEVFNELWRNGYNFGDGVQTAINGVILVINTLVTFVNILITPLRISAGIILTILSLFGINIARPTIVTNTLNWILDSAAIPLIPPTYNAENDTNYFKNTSWQFENRINYGSTDAFDWTWEMDFTNYTHQTQWQKIRWTADANGQNMKIYYIQETGNEQDPEVVYLAYNNGQWTNEAYTRIYIADYIVASSGRPFPRLKVLLNTDNAKRIPNYQ